MSVLACYHCGMPSTSREHFPPKSFFPREEGYQLRTVRSCHAHNGGKSTDDQYLLAHITIHASSGDNLAKQIFLRSVLPQLRRNAAFVTELTQGRVDIGDGEVAYPVDLRRFDRFFSALCRAVYFERFQRPLDPADHDLNHIYLSLTSSDPKELAHREFMRYAFQQFFSDFTHLVETYDGARQDDIVYRNHVSAPAGTKASITIAHTFYGIFEVISLLTRRPPTRVRDA